MTSLRAEASGAAAIAQHLLLVLLLSSPWLLAGGAGYVMFCLLSATSLLNVSRQPMRRFENLARVLLLSLAVLGSMIALGGELRLNEVFLVAGCSALDEVRRRFSLERSTPLMTVFWLTHFVISPVLYLAFTLPYLSNENLVAGENLPVFVISMALPFQVFAAYVPELPRAQHLVYAFAFVEVLLAARQESLHELLPLLALFLVLMVMCMVTTNVSVSLRRAKNQANAALREAQKHVGAQFSACSMLLSMIVSSVVLGFVVFLIVAPIHASKKEDKASEAAPELASNTFEFDDEGDLGSLPAITNQARTTDLDTTDVVEAVRLNDVGPLLEDPAVVAEVTLRIPDVPSDTARDFLVQPLLKATSLIRFENNQWEQIRGSSLSGYYQGPEGSIDVKEVLRAIPRSARNNVTVTVEFPEPREINKLSLLTVGAPIQVNTLKGADGLPVEGYFVRYDAYSAELQWYQEDKIAISGYEMVSRLCAAGGARGRPQDGGVAPRFLVIPDGIRAAFDQRFDAPSLFDAFSEQPIELAETIEDWFRFRGGFSYSLTQRPTGPNAIVDFICDPAQRFAHCEFYASAMALLLRYYGVGARVAVGYSLSEVIDGGEANERRYLMRKKDAHAWVEVYDEASLLWIPFDPTPADERIESRNDEEVLNNTPKEVAKDTGVQDAAIDQLSDKDRWPEANAFLLGYDSDVNGFLGERVSEYLGAALRLFVTFWWLSVAFLLAGIGYLVWRQVRRSRRSEKADSEREVELPSTQRRVSELYKRLIQALGEIDERRDRWQTPMEFAERLCKKHGESFDVFVEATQVYYAMRYTEVAPDSLPSRLDQLLAQVTQMRPTPK